MTNLVEGIRRIRHELTELDFFDANVLMIKLVNYCKSWRTGTDLLRI